MMESAGKGGQVLRTGGSGPGQKPMYCKEHHRCVHRATDKPVISDFIGNNMHRCSGSECSSGSTCSVQDTLLCVRKAS